MRKLILLSILLVLGTGIALISGCNSSGTQQVMGDPNDPNFLFVEAIVGDQALGNVERILDISFLFVDSIPGSSFSPKNGTARQALAGDFFEVDSFNYSYTNGWHEFAFWMKVLDSAGVDTVVVTGIDSLRALDNGTPLQVPDSTVDELNVRCHYTFDLNSGVFSGSADYGLDMTGISTDPLNPVTINASGTETLVGTAADSEVTCDFDLSNTLAANDVVAQLDGSSDCPTSGSINLTANIDISCTGQIGSSIDTVAIQGEWNIGAIFNNGTVTLSYTDGTSIWEATEPCGPTASPFARWTPSMH